MAEQNRKYAINKSQQICLSAANLQHRLMPTKCQPVSAFELIFESKPSKTVLRGAQGLVELLSANEDVGDTIIDWHLNKQSFLVQGLLEASLDENNNAFVNFSRS